jgi:hypothetical protein
MSLDFHIGNTEDEASQVPPRLQIDPGNYKLVFNDRNRAHYLQLACINYHVDSVFPNAILQDLRAEALQAAHQFRARTEQSIFLLKLADVCDEALRFDWGLFVFAD